MTTKVTILKNERKVKVNEVEIPGLLDYEVDFQAMLSEPIVKILIRADTLEVKDK